MLQKIMLSAKPWQQFLLKLLSFILLAIATLLFFLCLAAIGITRIDTPEYILIPLTTILLTVSSFLDSYRLGRVFKEKGMVIGIIIGTIFSVLIIALAVYFKTFAFTKIFATKITAVMLAGIFGGILGVN